jgi:integrase
MTLTEFLGHYILSREIRPKSCDMLRGTIAAYSLWLTRPATIGDLTDTQVSTWLVHLAANKKRSTVKGHRGRLLALWRSAFERHLAELPPLRVRPIIVPDANIRALSEADLRRLLDTCDGLTGRFKNRWRHRRRDYGRALFLMDHNTGARLGDIETFRPGDIRDDGSIWWTQSKTGKEQGAKLWPETIDAIRLIIHPERPTIFGALDERYKFRWLKAIFQAAGLDATFRFIRRASGSLVERDNPGWGHKHLGNTPEVFRKHYEDRRITGGIDDRPMPPRIV